MGLRILVIDDNPGNLELAVYLLGAYGHEVISAENGGEGMRKALEPPLPDLVLSDIHLPDFDGTEIVRRLKANPAFRAVPIVALTASAMTSDRERIMSAGFDGYFTKPIQPDVFVPEIEKLRERILDKLSGDAL